jgi:hypothetical protein
MPVRWKELFAEHADTASDIVKTTTVGTYTYDTASDFVEPSSYVRTTDVGGGHQYWKVIPPQQKALYVSSQDYICWFTGNGKDGFTLHFNPNVTLTTGDTINYEYYKTASNFVTTTSTTEMADDYFIVNYILAQFYKDEDVNLYKIHSDIANAKLNQMITKNSMEVETADDEDGAGFGF